MFRRANQQIVTQWEHSRLSGEIGMLLGAAADYDDPELFGAIALHDWPHFQDDPLTDEIEIGTKTDQQQEMLIRRLGDPLPIAPLAELLTLMHWRRLGAHDTVIQEVIRPARIASLRQDLGLAETTAGRMDTWTSLCDGLAFYLSRGEAADGTSLLLHPREEAIDWNLDWQVAPDTVRIQGLPYRVHRELSLLVFAAEGYPTALQPRFVSIAATAEPRSMN